MTPGGTPRALFHFERDVSLMLKNWRYEIDIIAYIKKSVLSLSL